MGTPITWQNVNAPDNRLAAQLFESSQNSINSGLDRFTKIITDREKGAQVMADRARMATQEEYLNMVQSYKTPEELQAARMSGVLDQRLAALDPRNQAAVRGAVDARVTGLQGQVTANNKFEKGQITAPVELEDARFAAENAPRVRAAELVAMDQKDALAEINNPTALTTARTAGTAADLAARLAPLTNANTEATAIEDAARLKEVSQGRAVDGLVNRFVQNHQQTSSAARNSITAVAKELGPTIAPLKADGSLAMEQMSSDQRKAFNTILQNRGLPSVDTLETGDTKAKTTLLNDLAARGYNVSHIARISPGLDFSLNTGPVAPIGGDLAAFNAQIAKRDAVQAQLENQYGVKTEPGSVGPLLKDGLAIIDGVLPKDSIRSEIYKERLGAFLNKGGIKNTLKDEEGKPVLGADGKPIVNRVLPTAAQLQVIISSIDKGWTNTRMGGMQREIDDALAAWADSAEAQKGAAELTKLGFIKQLQTVKKAEAPLPAVLGGKR